MVLKVAHRGQIPPFIVMDVMRAAAKREAEGASVLHLEVGQPSTGLPEGVRAELARRIMDDTLGYTVALGLDGLRSAIARFYRETQNADVDPARIAITTGSSAGFVLAFLAAFEAGDRVGLAMPGYPAYRHILTALGCEPVLIPVGPETRYQPTVEVLDRLDKPLDGLIVASPANPTGTVIPPEDLQALVTACGERGIRLISDEIYHGITYGPAAVSTVGMAEHPVVVNSFSKYFCMTGWRLGWLVLPPELVRPVECLAQNLFISPPALSQHAGIIALDHREAFEGNIQRYARNRRILLDGLPAAGLTRFAPADGAFYLYADVGHLTNNSLDFCARVLNETGIAITPGLDFDDTDGARWVRFSFCGSTETVATAVERLTPWLEGRKSSGRAGL
ncbi:pyridoxal phosphate-dependent aminotransferase [Pararhodospirillum photometricum]|uniref:aspartate transaminase n=1 Tax=Pararhodospirillum photometricum DSM 122 TaxID=1150469 RepID=H6SNB4_PARPM|nr:aminotransferase class I/II-fold pyridoxal phosphate-dependent enzyme [Pararhodospirillum photometricum]CCG06990.1 Aminotransferase [Pararhodospirillum photometricum DSM 122]